LPDRLARLGNRLDASEQLKIFELVDARIPAVTSDDLRAIRMENAKDDERFSDLMRDLWAAKIEGHRGMIGKAEATIAEAAPQLQIATEDVERAKDRLARIERGETVSGGLHKRMDIEVVFDEAGVTKRERKRWLLMGSLTSTEFEALADQTWHAKGFFEVIDRPINRAARKIILIRRA
jgi:hypothetical protein